MEIVHSPDIFQAKLMKPMATLEFIRDYIDDFLCNTKGTLEDRLAKLELVLWTTTCKLKSNCLLILCAVETEYLVYILTRL